MTSAMTFSPDGNWYWDGQQWIPSPPVSNHVYPGSQHHIDNLHRPLQFDDNLNSIPLQNMIITDTKQNFRKNVIIVGAIISLFVFGVIGAIFLSIPDPVEPDQVTLTYFYVHNGDEVVATYADQYGNIQQDFDYYEGDFVIQYNGEMYEGDIMIGTISVTNFDEDLCAATVIYMVSINGGDYIELAKTGPAFLDQYDAVRTSYTYIHGEV